jgi:hypothetical protein
MRYRSSDQWRDLAVRLLARLSLVMVLAVLGAMFVGSAATSQAASDRAAESTVSADEQISPVGLLIGAGVIGGGLVVLMIGAFRPPTAKERRERREFADLAS